MPTKDELVTLVKEGLSTAEAAVRLEISRQRVYQLALKYGLKFARRRAIPSPRLLTGGIPVIVSTSVAGKVAELIVAADLLARGWHVFLPVYANGPHDIIAAKDGRVATFEVRSAHRNATGRLIFPIRSYDKSDHYGIVATGEIVSYQPDL